MAFGVVTFFLRKQGNGKKNRPVALDPQKKIPFKLVDKKVSAYKLPERGIRTHFFLLFPGDSQSGRGICRDRRKPVTYLV